MATIIKRGKILYVQWFNPSKSEMCLFSTNLTDTPENRKEAAWIAEAFQNELNKTIDSNFNQQNRISTIQEAFDHFLANNQNKHPKTIKDYHRFFNKFTQSFPPTSFCTTLNKLSVESWFNQIKKLLLAKNTIHGYGKQCIHFLNFLFEYSYIQPFKINREVKTKPEETEKIVFKDEDLVKIFDGLVNKKSNFITLIYFLFYTGLRQSDVLTITKDKIDIQNQEMNYFMQKGRKHRHIPFHSALIPIIENRIAEIDGGKIILYENVENLGRAVSRYFTELGIKNKGYSARTFRKTFITLARNRFHIDASIVKELVGHSHGNVTDRYYNLIDMETLKKELNKFERPIL